MLLASALFVLFMAGCWLYCLIDAVLTPASECPGVPKPAWVAVIAITFVAGAFAWLITRRLSRYQARSPAPALGLRPDGDPGWTGSPDVSGSRSLRAVSGPDDDPDFIRALAAAIRRDPPVS
jgi:hypothetical protein